MRTLWIQLGLSLSFCLLPPLAVAAPASVRQDVEELDPELTAGYFEGDIDLTYDRNGFITTTRRWPSAVVYYKIDEMFDDEHVNHIKLGMQLIELSSCIRFQPADENTENFVFVTGESSGCSSSVGFRGGQQRVNLQTYAIDVGCFRLGTIQHEFLHALGFYHQQSAPDRDDYVQIVEENITDGKEHNFRKYDFDVVTDFDVPYDYGSVLHYSSLAFSSNGLPTIVPLNNGDGSQMGQRLKMSKTDIDRLNIMYKCPVNV